VLALSPIPGLATHMHRDTMTPLINWESIIEDVRNRI
jgi:hypothetical protein